MKNKKKFGAKNTAILFVLAVLAFLLFVKSFNSGFKVENKSNSNLNNYDSVEKMLSSTSIKIELPQFIAERTDLEIRDVMGQIIEIGCNDFVFKAANFIDNNADVLGLYEKAEIDNKYFNKVEDYNIKFFRYRNGYPGYENCTLVNWCTTETTYGIMLSGIYTEAEVLNLLSIDKDNLTEDIVSNELEISMDTDEYNINNLFTVELPKFNSSLKVMDLDGYTSFYLDKMMCFVFVYNDLDIVNNTFGSQKCIQLDENLYLYYREENPFKEGTVAYIDYNNFMGTVNNIADSIKYQN